MLTDSESVYDWPEFQALARRLGIPLDLRWLRLDIRLERGCSVTIKHEYVACDRDERDAAALRKQAITTVADLAGITARKFGSRPGHNPAA